MKSRPHLHAFLEYGVSGINRAMRRGYPVSRFSLERMINMFGRERNDSLAAVVEPKSRAKSIYASEMKIRPHNSNHPPFKYQIDRSNTTSFSISFP
jgi:hypothetical protein